MYLIEWVRVEHVALLVGEFYLRDFSTRGMINNALVEGGEAKSWFTDFFTMNSSKADV